MSNEEQPVSSDQKKQPARIIPIGSRTIADTLREMISRGILDNNRKAREVAAALTIGMVSADCAEEVRTGLAEYDTLAAVVDAEKPE
jgi:hypothetical protein